MEERAVSEDFIVHTVPEKRKGERDKRSTIRSRCVILGEDDHAKEDSIIENNFIERFEFQCTLILVVRENVDSFVFILYWISLFDRLVLREMINAFQWGSVRKRPLEQM